MPRVAIPLLCLLLFASGTAHAQMYRDGPPPRHRLIYKNLAVFRWNPIGLISDARFMYRYRLFESESLALRDNFVSIGLAPVVSGGFSRLGVQAEVQPLTILNLWALYEVVGYYGAFNFLQSFPSATSDYSDSTLATRGSLPSDDPAKNYAATGTQLMFGANLTLKVKSIVVRTQARFGIPRMNLREGDRVFYDIVYDLLVQNGSMFFNNDADVLWQNDEGTLTLGVRWSQAQAFYDDGAFAGADDRGLAPGMTQKIGPLFAYTWKKEDGARSESTLIAMANWWFSHPHRTGSDVSQAVPYFVIGWATTGDLTPR